MSKHKKNKRYRKIKTNKKSKKIITDTIVFFCTLASCDGASDYEKLKKPIKTHADASIILDEIKKSLKIKIPDDVLPVVFTQMYPTEDFIERELYFDLETFASFSAKEYKKMKKLMPMPNGMVIYSSSGQYGNEIEPIFKDFMFNEDEKSLSVLYFLLPIVFIGEEQKIDKTIDEILNSDNENFESLEKCLKNSFGLSGDFSILSPDVVCFLEEDVKTIFEGTNEEIKKISDGIKISYFEEKNKLNIRNN